MADDEDLKYIPLVVIEHWSKQGFKSDPSLSDTEDRITNISTTYDTPNNSTCSLSVGTLVEVITDISEPLYGVVRWVGNNGLAGIELEEDHEHLPLHLTDGTYNGQRFFSCANGRALFVPLKQCQKDSRFDDEPKKEDSSAKMFGGVSLPTLGFSLGNQRIACPQN